MTLLRLLSRGNNNDGPSNVELVRQLQVQGALSDPLVIHAFQGTDRALFIEAAEEHGGSDHAVDLSSAYIDMPLRHGLLHLSAPSIYAVALEALELSAGQTFLNVGSGTGYLSSIVATILGSRSVQFGVECKPELVAHSRAKLHALGHNHVQLVEANCFAIDPESSMRFERIYVGAGASQRSASLLFRLLEIGGVCVGPFAAAHGSQRILQVRRVGEARFEVSVVLNVQFTPLINPWAGSAAEMAPLPPVSLRAPLWSPEEHRRFDARHRKAVVTVLLLHHCTECLLASLPKELIVQVVLPHLPFGAFRPAAVAAYAHVEGGSGEEEALERAAHTAASAARAVAGGGGLRWGQDEEEEDEEDGEEEEEEDEDEGGGDGEEESLSEMDEAAEAAQEAAAAHAQARAYGHHTPPPPGLHAPTTHQPSASLVSLLPFHVNMSMRTPHATYNGWSLAPPAADGGPHASHHAPYGGPSGGLSGRLGSGSSGPAEELDAALEPSAALHESGDAAGGGQPSDAEDDGGGLGDGSSSVGVGSGTRIAAMRRGRALRRILARLLREGAAAAGMHTSSSNRQSMQAGPSPSPV